MNAPLPDRVMRALSQVQLDDKYSLPAGRVFLSGTQALVRLLMLQRQRDERVGLKTAGFVSGYRGSPLGALDQALWSAKGHLKASDIVFQPGVNEELAATAVWGTQQLDLLPAAQRRVEGVFGLWYGKGPGVDRCVDVFKHANLAGTSRWGGVLAVAGDDHVAKSSTAAHQSDHVFKACGFPVFFPSDVQGILDMGIHALAMSRFAGLWTGMKTIQEVVESSSSVEVDPERVKIVLPEDFALPPSGVHIRWPDAALDQERRLFDSKWYAALAYVRANRLNFDVVRTPQDRFGLIASGKAYNDLRQALHDLGLDDDTCRALGIRVHKVNVVWPLEAHTTREFAQGLQEILVVEEKRQVIEYQLKEELYNWRSDVRPDVLGKFDEPEGDHSGGEWSHPNPSANTLLRANADLSPALIAQAVARRLNRRGLPADIRQRMSVRLAQIEARETQLQQLQQLQIDTGERTPWFCSGCPHNTSTQVPEGSRAMAGIGCHYMALWMDRRTSTFSQMGGEGAAWVGQAPFTQERHVFVNLGDGTYFHSGILAIRQAIASGVNVTYKILYNGAVAMTGGQPLGERAEGLSVAQIVQSCLAEGVRTVAVATDEPARYQGVRLGDGVQVHHRDEWEALQQRFRELPGTTVLLFDQTCATEKRRRRKRGTMADPAQRVVIHEGVCEGCGDCGVQSNCLSVEPLETEFGRKRQINQSSCNKDFSCTKGFCPSFVTVQGGRLRQPAAPAQVAGPAWDDLPPLPQPSLPPAHEPWGIVVAGVGGTGVITIGQLLGMAAHLEGRAVVTQDAAGLAQKGGATWSHIQICDTPDRLFTTKVDVASADLVLACEAIVGASRATLQLMQPGRTHVVLNTHGTPTAAFVKNAQWDSPAGRCEAVLRDTVGERLATLDADTLAQKLLGDRLYANPLLLGYAWQRGWVPLSLAALTRAIELNGVQVPRNLAAFTWGRHLASHGSAVMSKVQTTTVIHLARRPSLDQRLDQRAAFLQQYQNAAWAQRYRDRLSALRSAEARAGLRDGALADTVAQQLYRLMAIKDEYEVARLLTDPAFEARLHEQFEGDFRLVHHLAPPLWARRDAQGHLLKRAYGPWVRWVFRGLKHLKFLRGSPLDLFGYTQERREERRLLMDYEGWLDEVVRHLNAANLTAAHALLNLPEQVRGFGHVKERNVAAMRAQQAQRLASWSEQRDQAPA